MTKLFASLLIFLFLGLDKCSEDEKVRTDRCFEVSIVESICRQAVLKIENPAYHYLGENWNGYQNVFFTLLDCSVDEARLAGKKFFVTLEENETDNNCGRCKALLAYGGEKKYLVKVHEECPAVAERKE